MAKSGGFTFDRRGVVAAVLASVALVACGDAPEAGEGTVVAASVDGAIEKPNLKFGFIKLTDMAPLAIAKEKGYFAEEGLNVTLEPQANWKVLLDGVIGGQLDGAHMLAGQPLAATIGYGTKADLIAGFAEFFDNLGKEDREQVWGFTLPLDVSKDEASPIAAFDSEKRALHDHMCATRVVKK